MEPNPEMQIKLMELDREVAAQRVIMADAEAVIAELQLRRIELFLEARRGTNPAQ